MKLDKDTLLKNRFWVLLGVAASLTLIGWLFLLFSVPSAVGKEKQRVESVWSKNKNVTEFKGREFVDQEQKIAAELKGDLSKVNKNLFYEQSTQATVMSWPPGMEEYDFLNGLYAYEVKITYPAKKGASRAEIFKGLPQDTAKEMSGILTKADSEWFWIEDAKGKEQKFYRTAKIKFDDPKSPKQLQFGQLSNKLTQPVVVKYIKGKYFGDEFTIREKEAYVAVYKKQLPDVLATLGPVNAFNETVVQLRMPGSSKEIVNECWVYDKTREPSNTSRFFGWTFWDTDPRNVMSEEIWAAQETIWVQREIYKQLKAANDSLVMCERIGKDGKSATFKNYYWQIKLAIEGNAVSVQLKNLRPFKQNVDTLRFFLTFKDPSDKSGTLSDPVLFPPKGQTFLANSVGPAGGGNDVFPEKGTRSFVIPGVTLRDMDFHSVVQVQTLETAAVKRLDVLTIGAAINGEMAVSHREGLKKPLVAFNPKAAPPAPIVAPKPVDPGADPKDAPPPDEPGEIMSTDIVKKFTRNKLLLERYIEKTKAGARRLPVCIVMVVGPDHIARVQAHLVSSPLRFLETQVFLQRAVLTAGSATPSGSGGGGAAAAAKTSAAGGGGLGDSNENVELTVYGVVTLYDRPERPGGGP